VFLPGKWDVGTFFTYYTMIFVCIVLFGGWKIVKRTKFVKAHEADLIWEKPTIDRYEEATTPPLGLWEDLIFQSKKCFKAVVPLKIGKSESV
jgi:yeast amino acid transporter